jgi:CarD family transcriptional regulator
VTPEAGDILETLQGDPDSVGRKWSRWYEVLNEKMTSGDMVQVAEVVRDLSISPALQRMLSAGRRTLVSELVSDLDIDEKEAIRWVDQALTLPEEDEE